MPRSSSSVPPAAEPMSEPRSVAASDSPPASAAHPPATPAAAPQAAAPPTHLAYVDAIEGDVARVLFADRAGEWRPFTLPLHVLPADIKENSWVSLRGHTHDPPPWAESVRSLRARLGRDDDGGDFSL